MTAPRRRFLTLGGARPALIAIAMIGLAAGCSGEKPTGPPAPKTNGSAIETQPAPDGEAKTTKPERHAPPLGMLIEPDALQKRLEEPTLRILDARPADAYVTGHIPGAVFVETDPWKQRALEKGGLHDEQAWAEAVSQLGITRGTNVVVYAANVTRAARVWWMLKYFGVDNVALLDGGWDLWNKQGRPVSQDEPLVEATTFRPKFQERRLEQISDLKRALAAGEATVVDARSPQEYAGTAGPGERQGHIAGAVHLEWKQLLDEDGTFKSPEELKSLFEQRGIAKSRTVVTHCQTGGRSSVEAFALELAGIENVKNYYCGWHEWSADPDAPVEKTGAEKGTNESEPPDDANDM